MADLTQLKWFDDEYETMVSLLKEWVSINSCSYNPSGLDTFLQKLIKAFSIFKCDIEEIDLLPQKSLNEKGLLAERQTAKALYLSQRKEAPFRIFFGGHMDTVLYFDHIQENDSLRGPGVADMKGGLVVMLKVIEAIEKSSFANKVGWEVVINPDEEIGSPSSTELISKKAKGCDVALIFEPTLEDGSLVSQRKGSINYSLVAKGKASHAGRDFNRDNNAITKLCRALLEIESLNKSSKGMTINIGVIKGGKTLNTVPDVAFGQFNIRVDHPQDMEIINQKVTKICDSSDLYLHQETMRPPKPFDKAHRELFDILEKSSKSLNMNLKWKPSGGVCDGNIVAAAGVPTIDTMGVVGGHLHTKQEYVKLNSLPEKAKCAFSLISTLVEMRTS